MGCIHHPSCFFLHHVCCDPPKKSDASKNPARMPSQTTPPWLPRFQMHSPALPFCDAKITSVSKWKLPGFPQDQSVDGSEIRRENWHDMYETRRKPWEKLPISTGDRWNFSISKYFSKKYLISRTRKNGAKLPTVTFWHGRVPFNSRIYSKWINKKHFTTFQQMIWINLILLLLLLLWDIGAFHYTNFIHI